MSNSVAVFNASNALIGTFTTIQAAIDASAAGYSVYISAGVFSESVTIDVAVNIYGAGVGQTIVTPPTGDGFLVSGDLGAASTLHIQGVEFLGSADGSGVRFADGSILGLLSINNAEFEDNFRNGLQVGGGAAPVALGNVIVTNTDFIGNGGYPNLQSSSGDGDMLFYQYYGDATISNVTLTGMTRGAGAAENGIQFRGDAGALGNVTLTNVDIGGVYEKQPIAFFNYANVDGLSGSGVTITADSTSFQLAANFDNVGGAIDFASLGITTTGAPDIVALQGNATSQAITGGDEDSRIIGRGGDDTLDGGDGHDFAVYTSGTSADFTIGIAVDSEGFATAFTSVTDNVAAGGDEGVDSLANVEALVFIGDPTRFNVNDPVQLFDTANNLVGTYLDIQSAVDNAADGFTVLVSAGTYREQVTVNGLDDITIRGVNGAVTIEAPDTLAQTSTSSSGREVFAVVTVENGANVVFENIDVDGRGVTTGLSGANPNNIGVYYRNASGGLENVNVSGVHDPYPGGVAEGGEPIVSGVQRGVGVQADNDAGPQQGFFMHGGSISDFQKNATVFGYADLDISGVTITGGGAQTIIAQNGLQAYNSSGTISGNTITGIGYAGPAEAYSGAILAYGNTDLDIVNNVIVGSNDDDLAAKVVGVFIFDFGTPNSGGTVSGNSISFVDTGIGIYGDIQPNQVAISGNSISNIDLSDPYAAGIDHQPNGGLPTAFDVQGSALQDTLMGSDANDRLFGLGGDDLLSGGAGDDTLVGSAGADLFNGGAGADTADYSDASGGVTVKLWAGTGQNFEAQGDTLIKIEHLIGTAFNDRLIGIFNQDNRFNGGAGNDYMDGLGGADTLLGEQGEDRLIGGAGGDLIDGGAGNDIASYGSSSAGVSINIETGATSGGDAAGDTLVSIEGVIGSGFADFVTGNGGYNVIQGNGGADTLDGAGGWDFINGGNGADLIIGGAGNDTLKGGLHDDTFRFAAGHGADRIDDFIAGNAGGDVIELAGLGAAFDTFAEVMAATTQQGANTLIDLGGGNSILLVSVNMTALNAADFLFS